MTTIQAVDWRLIAVLADALGVKRETVDKWRERRSVPHRWRLQLILQSKGQLSINDPFEDS